MFINKKRKEVVIFPRQKETKRSCCHGSEEINQRYFTSSRSAMFQGFARCCGKIAELHDATRVPVSSLSLIGHQIPLPCLRRWIHQRNGRSTRYRWALLSQRLEPSFSGIRRRFHDLRSYTVMPVIILIGRSFPVFCRGRPQFARKVAESLFKTGSSTSIRKYTKFSSQRTRTIPFTSQARMELFAWPQGICSEFLLVSVN